MSRFNLGKLRLDARDGRPGGGGARRRSTRCGLDRRRRPRFVLDFEPPFRPIHVDTSRLQQIIWNLLSNAIKFSPPGGRDRRRAARGSRAACASRVSRPGPGHRPGVPAVPVRPLHAERRRQQPPARRPRARPVDRQAAGRSRTAARSRRAAKGSGAAACSRSGCRSTVHPPTSASAARPRPSTGCPSSTADRDVPLDGLHLLVVDDDREASAMLADHPRRTAARAWCIAVRLRRRAARAATRCARPRSSATSACRARTATSWSARSGGARPSPRRRRGSRRSR